MKYNKKRVRKIKRLVKRLVGNVVFILLVLLLTTIMFNKVSGKKEYKTNTVTIASNDTIWNIAKNICNENSKLDINKVIYDIKEINGLENANIHIGQEIEVPIY